MRRGAARRAGQWGSTHIHSAIDCPCCWSQSLLRMVFVNARVAFIGDSHFRRFQDDLERELGYPNVVYRKTQGGRRIAYLPDWINLEEMKHRNVQYVFLWVGGNDLDVGEESYKEPGYDLIDFVYSCRRKGFTTYAISQLTNRPSAWHTTPEIFNFRSEKLNKFVHKKLRRYHVNLPKCVLGDHAFRDDGCHLTDYYYERVAIFVASKLHAREA